jgi:hypothetical protein
MSFVDCEQSLTSVRDIVGVLMCGFFINRLINL